MRPGAHIYTIIMAALVVCGYACKQKYVPEVDDNNPNYFVVEGLINTGADSTIFTLSRTFKLESKAVVTPEKGAVVQVESDAGTIYQLPELVKSGNYGRPALNLDLSKKYRLRIRTKDNKEYLSDFVECKTSPPVDKVTYDFKGNTFNMYAHTHDPAGKSKYYKFQYIETWQYTAGTMSLFKIENHQILPRIFPQDDIFNCWKSVPSSNIVLGTTENYSKDRLDDVLLNAIAPTSFKIRIGYSILVKQTVLTKQGFEFWQALQKNTEKIGSIFDSQPSQLMGNIKSTSNPNEVVIGFVSAGTVTEKRLTLSTYQMPDSWRQKPELDSLTLCDSAHLGLPGRAFSLNTPIGRSDIEHYLLSPAKSKYVILDGIYVDASLVGYSATSYLSCADCRWQGGTTP